ncbi:MAG: ATPase domain-containing protein [Bryobacteraceae bacterium]
MSETDLVRTGIKGLDAILFGSIPRSNVILVQGPTGSGKTLLGIEFIYRGIVEYDEPAIIVAFENSPDKLVRDAATFGWDLQKLQAQKKLQIIFTTPHVLDQELRSPDSLLLETVAEIGAQRIFIDGIGLLGQSSNGDTLGAANEIVSYRELLQRVIEGLDRENLTAMLSHEVGVTSESILTLEATAFLADTVIHLGRSRQGRRMVRSIEVIKSRGQDFDSGEHTLKISGNQGLQVFRRVQAPIRMLAAQPTSTAKRSVTGVEALDTLIGGGLFDGSTTMVVGVSGVGKTVLGTHLLWEGATRQGTRGLLISLDEHPAQIIRNAATLGLDLQTLIDSGQLHILFESPQELDIDTHFAKITDMVEKYDIQRMVIDGMTSYSTALKDQSVYRDFFHALVAYSKFRLMTAFFNYENPEFLGISTFMPDFPVSSIVDNIILLSMVELRSSLRRCLTVVKARGSKHQFDSREYEIGQGGINLLPFDEDAQSAPVPFAGYTSILSRAPTRLSARDVNGLQHAAAGSK